jgi:two-component system, LytTR family, response regulator
MTAPPIRALVVDDQPVARERLVSLLAEEADVELVGTCATGVEAVRAIRRLAPNLVFLDMQMPELDGLAVVEAVGVDRMPLTVFVTAYDEYAVRAFDAQALDYLLKPFARPRFARAVARVRERLAGRERAALTGRLLQAVESMRERARPPVPRLIVKSGGRVLFVDVPQIDWVEAEGNYARVHLAGGQQHLVRDTMTELLGRLGEDRFIRVHRSAIVNLGRVAELRLAAGGDYDVVLTSGTHVPLSRSFRDQLQARLASAPTA